MIRIRIASALALLFLSASRLLAQDISIDDPIYADATSRSTESLDVGAASRPTTNASVVARSPESASAQEEQFPSPAGVFGLDEFVNHFAPYEPMYFIGGWTSPDVKFQFSIRYRLFTPTGPLAIQQPWVKGFNFAYSQTSLWDFSKPSAPFFDTSYRPEFFYYLENIPQLSLSDKSQIGAQLGIGHESNGRDGPDSRTVNMVYIRPIANIPLNSQGLFLIFAPKIYTYVESLGDNPDIQRYRGNADIRAVLGWRDGLQLAAIGRIGSSFNRGSIQLDLTYPLTKILHGNTDLSIDAQYFQGYGESLLTYNQVSSVFRIGFSIVR